MLILNDKQKPISLVMQWHYQKRKCGLSILQLTPKPSYCLIIVSAYKFTLIDYNCNSPLLSNYFTDLFQKNPVPKVPTKVEVGLVFKVKKSALNINPFVEADTTPCIKERRLCIMGNNPDLLNISRHFQTRKHPSNRNLMAKY